MLRLEPTKRFSVWTTHGNAEEAICEDSFAAADAAGGDAPLSDSCLQVLLETMNLVPQATTEKVPFALCPPTL